MSSGAGGIISPGHADARRGETIPRHLVNCARFLMVHQHLIQVYRYRYACIRCWCTTGANLQDEAQGTILCAAQPVHGIVLCALPLGQCHSLGYGISSREGRLRVIRYRFSGEQVLTTSATGSFPTGAHSVTSGEMIPRGTFVLFPYHKF